MKPASDADSGEHDASRDSAWPTRLRRLPNPAPHAATSLSPQRSNELQPAAAVAPTQRNGLTSSRTSEAGSSLRAQSAKAHVIATAA